MSIEIKNINISKLDLSNQNLKEIPKEIFALKNLKKLILRNNQIKIIPSDIERLKRLETLDLSGNNISNFYAKICSLTNLKILNLNNNKIKSLPIQIANLQNLLSLHISNNIITVVPQEIYKLKKVRELDISNNSISVIDNNIHHLKSLRKLWINNLPLKTFPLDLYLPKSLVCLYAFSKSNNFFELDQTYLKLSLKKGNCLNYLNSYEFDLETDSINSNKEMEMVKEIKKNKVFISYSHKDKVWLELVKKNLDVLKSHLQIDIDIWDDQKLEVGDLWKDNIKSGLDDAGIAIFLVSTDFLSSNFINQEEIPPILENSAKNGTVILPIILKFCYFDASKLSKYQALNTPSTPLSTMTENEIDKHLVNLTKKIHEIMQNLG